jgi:hypothetical protein
MQPAFMTMSILAKVSSSLAAPIYTVQPGLMTLELNPARRIRVFKRKDWNHMCLHHNRSLPSAFCSPLRRFPPALGGRQLAPSLPSPSQGSSTSSPSPPSPAAVPGAPAGSGVDSDAEG